MEVMGPLDFILDMGELFLSWRFCVGLAVTARLRCLAVVTIARYPMFKYATPVLHVESSAVATTFYCGKLGFEMKFAYRPDENQDDPGYMGVARDDVWLHLSSFSGDGVAGGAVFLAVENVDIVHAELLAKGEHIDTEPVHQTWVNREMYIKDADGNSIRFVQPGASA